MNSHPGPIVINLGEKNGILTFETVDNLRSWYFGERNKWGWINPNVCAKAESWNLAHENLRQRLSNVDSTTRQESIEKDIPLKSFIDYLEGLYRNDELIYSDSIIGVFLSMLAKRGAIRACAALDHLTGFSPPLFPPNSSSMLEAAKGNTEAILFEKGLVGDSPVESSLNALFPQYQEAFLMVIRAAKENENLLNEEINRLKSESEQIKNNWNDLLKKAADDRVQEFDALKEKTDAIEKTYREAIQLQAPVDYWEGQERHHISESEKYQARFFILCALYLFVMMLLAWGVQANSGHLGYERYGLLAIAATLGGAVVRLFYKLYINHVHGASHAKEKVVQIKTFLALGTEGNKLGSEEMHLLLSTILRPRATALLKDEFPIVSPIELIQKVSRSG